MQDNLNDARQLAANLYGTSGSTPESLSDTDTVRGKILINQLADASRIGGGVSEFIEQMADTWYNKVLQIMYVYYDVASVLRRRRNLWVQEIVQFEEFWI